MLVLKGIADSRGFGIGWASKQVTRFVFSGGGGARDEVSWGLSLVGCASKQVTRFVFSGGGLGMGLVVLSGAELGMGLVEVLDGV